MKISVITPVLNGEKFIRQTVESVISQSGDFDLEYIVCDGQSTDKTLDILSGYSDGITIISERDGSPQEAINKGMEIASGEVKCWLNSDDLFLPGTLQKVATAFRANVNRDWLYGRCNIIDENDKEIRKPITLYKNLIGFIYSRNMLMCENYINQPATFWRAGLWEKTQPLNPIYKAAWDYELWLKMAGESRAIHLRDTLSMFRRHASSISEQHFQRQFAEEYTIAASYGNFLHRAIHKLNQLKIIFIYKLLGS